MKPVSRIVTQQDLTKWTESSTLDDVLTFVVDLQNLVEGKENNDKTATSETLLGILLMKLLDATDALIDTNPVEHEKDVSRFGKIEFRLFYDDVATLDLSRYLPQVPTTDAIEELQTYYGESWGNRQRIDYGLGHELNFICFLYCLKQLEILTPSDYQYLILKVFVRYIEIMRRLQKIYWLEPAGSHGVWGLDDYHFLPYLFGASQLSGHPYFKPKLIHNAEVMEEFHSQFMYFECIYFINNIKTLPKSTEKLSIRWHSPMLDDILAAKSWTKIKEGMVKMYKAEVLNKLPIIQHFKFGSLIECPEGIPEHSDHLEDECGHVHNQAANTWGDCCGIKIPSAIAASESIRLQQEKLVPFD
ncbi:Serine/threonine-protein phosphatase 2A activator 2 [Scheffersomyces spartinae]|uniref:Serine/threonine-protein phosphatase 2A activator n=1 Tax=Scheffersomyces spartinae TaxID=45513 RepID=A0A9P7VCL4_9ASCO|nr:Serine/threonine-protein phosphatase 2A activator 2 [Scheffersomyces spartinae]KAG7195036.1 Serine/threonine-protein phosphatase 2A activator 2 [Scheffersomyces spartinae]